MDNARPMHTAPHPASLSTPQHQGGTARFVRRVGGAVRSVIAGGIALTGGMRRPAAPKPGRNPPAPRDHAPETCAAPRRAGAAPDQPAARSAPAARRRTGSATAGGPARLVCALVRPEPAPARITRLAGARRLRQDALHPGGLSRTHRRRLRDPQHAGRGLRSRPPVRDPERARRAHRRSACRPNWAWMPRRCFPRSAAVWAPCPVKPRRTLRRPSRRPRRRRPAGRGTAGAGCAPGRAAGRSAGRAAGRGSADAPPAMPEDAVPDAPSASPTPRIDAQGTEPADDAATCHRHRVGDHDGRRLPDPACVQPRARASTPAGRSATAADRLSSAAAHASTAAIADSQRLPPRRLCYAACAGPP